MKNNMINERFIGFFKTYTLWGYFCIVFSGIITYFLSHKNLPKQTIVNLGVLALLYFIGTIIGWWKLVYKSK